MNIAQTHMIKIAQELERAEVELWARELDYPTHESRPHTARARGYRDGLRFAVEALLQREGVAS